MSRLCRDCGIADWQPCQCDERADMDAPRNPYQQLEQRATPRPSLAEGLVSVGNAFGDVCNEYRQGARAGVVLALRRLGAEAERLAVEVEG